MRSGSWCCRREIIWSHDLLSQEALITFLEPVGDAPELQQLHVCRLKDTKKEHLRRTPVLSSAQLGHLVVVDTKEGDRGSPCPVHALDTSGRRSPSWPYFHSLVKVAISTTFFTFHSTFLSCALIQNSEKSNNVDPP